MKLIATLAASATMLAATSFIPAGAMSPGRLDTSQLSTTEQTAQVCRTVCRNGFCRERCRWRPDRPSVRVYPDGYRAYGYDRRYRHRGPSVEFNIR
jgi:hypothetical protein